MERTAGRGQRSVILYELNEVPWEILDLYASRRPQSSVATLLARARCQTTVNEDHHDLQPWRTWPTFHKGMYCDQHGSFDLGQDPDTFRGENIWDVAEAEGLRIGVFAPLQSWPAHEPRNGGFYLPDTFSRTPETFPPSLRRFQAFNLNMTREQGFSAVAPLDGRELALAGLDMLAKGTTPRSAALILRQLVRERRDERFKAARPMMQALPSFDLFWRLHRKTRPHLSVFFTNHVAGMMHRYWGDAVPEYAMQFDYRPDEIFRRFLFEAMDISDRQLGRLIRYAERHPEVVVIVASSMGQGPVPETSNRLCYVVKDPPRLASVLELGPVQEGTAMYPHLALIFPSAKAAKRAETALSSVTVDGNPLFYEVRVEGVSASCEINLDDEVRTADPRKEVIYRALGPASNGRAGSVGEIGVEIATRLGGGNTAQHIPEGILLTFGQGIAPDSSRARISVLEAGPMILDLLGIDRRPAAERTAVGTASR